MGDFLIFVVAYVIGPSISIALVVRELRRTRRAAGTGDPK